ncbi:LOW QUALITY PROTEIN: uncharacterized protein LOC132546245 [Ylistrum balloti]|uniref:LOW QUALITY PROTEIN: uncharacterized protein LOC132546245 n=1 Tax=Ylistrum balloti TaxID=509963 RepID=UPI002905E34C|nr:LOW QUALITY PROTEIN: uncharacterized protein LOC132546245 [Ylistrum balloti]
MLDEDQAKVFETVKNGHNAVITGQAGCGTTFLVKCILPKRCPKKVSVVGSTGIAATHYGDLGAQTLHKWADIEDGRHSNEEIIHPVDTDERFERAKNNIQTVDVLIIDEVSMISARILDQVQLLCKHVRQSTKIFGNIQVVLVGDFYQLPPVSNELYGDPGNYCFRLPWFTDFSPHIYNLHLIHRQDDTNLIKCINALEKGELDDESLAFLNSLDTPLENEDSSLHLFARNLDVDSFNYSQLEKLSGELKIYKSTDEGFNYYLGKFLAPKNLGLKAGCPVMLVKNLSDSLVNGLRGIVNKLYTDSVDVKFTFGSKSVTVKIKNATFTTYGPVNKTIIARRVQLPLKVAYYSVIDL